MEGILPGEVAWYVTGRFYAGAGGALLDAGYFLHLQGIEGELFSGAPGEGTARLTFLADPFTSTPVQNGDLTLGMDAIGEFAVYLNRQPAATFDDPASFGAGEEIARFRRVAVVTGATLGTGTANQPLLGLNVFSAQLVSSRPFELDGQRYDLRRLMPSGITQWGTSAATPTGAVANYPTVLPFVGSAIAIGGAPPGGPGRGDPGA
ncbi:MAG TPA: hypothetical protein VLK84_09405 [Longimicrobium sp.]|nr:hypothetical protein [Longimicrobium sp.]